MIGTRQFVVWCDKAMVFSFYALIYFLPISIALAESFTGAALFLWFLKRGGVFYENFKKESLTKCSFSIFKIWRIFLRSFKPVFSCLNTPITLFLLFNLISVITSQHKMVSLEGFLGKVLQGSFIYFNFIECMNSEKRLRNFLNIFFISSFLICVNGLYQYSFGQEFIHGQTFEGRISSSFRQANDFGAYLVIVNAALLSVLHFDVRQIFNLGKYGRSGMLSGGSISVKAWGLSFYFILHVSLLILTLACLGLTYSRGAWIAMLIVVLIFCLGERKTVLINVIIIILFISIFYPRLQEQRNSGLFQTVQLMGKNDQEKESLQNLEIVSGLEKTFAKQEVKATEKRETAVKEIVQETSIPHSKGFFHQVFREKIIKIINKIETSGRITYWQEALRVVKDYPVFGVGVNTYSLVAPQYKISWGGYPHNCYLQMIAEIGIPGFLCFMWLLFRLFKNSIKEFKSRVDSFYKMLLLGVTAAFGGFLFHSFFDTFFYSVQLGSFMWVIIGFIVAMQSARGDIENGSPQATATNYKIKFFYVRKKIAHMISIVLIFYTFFFFFYIKRKILNPQYGIIFYDWGVRCGATCFVNERLKYFKKAIYYNPNLSEAYFQLGEVYEGLGDEKKAIESYRRVTELDHANWEAYLNMGYYYFRNGELDYALRYLKQSLKYLKGSYEYGGRGNEVAYYLGRIYEQRENHLEAISHYRRVDRSYKRYNQTLLRIGTLYHVLGMRNRAEEEIVELHKTSRHDLADQLQRFVETNQYPEFLKEGD